MASAVLVRGLGLLASMLTARLLGAEAFGQIGVVQQVVAMMGTLAGLGVGTTASRFIAANRSGSPERTGRILGATAAWSWGSAVIGCTLLASFAPWLASGPLASPSLTWPLLAALPLLLFSLVAQAQAGGLAGFESFRAVALCNAIGGVLGVPLQVLGAWQWGVPGFVCGAAAAEALRWMVGRRALVSEMARLGVHWRRPQLSECREMLGFGLPSMLASLLVGPVLLISFAIVGRQQGGFAEVGFFQATQQFRNIQIFIAVQIAGAVVPVLAAAHGAGDKVAVRSGLRRAAVWSLSSSIILAIGFTLLAPMAMSGFGPAFEARTDLLQWQAVMSPVQAMNAVGIAALSGLNRPWATLCATLAYGLSSLAVVFAWPSSAGLVFSQGFGSLLAMLVIAWALRADWILK
jgi:O-antigen/teichoic acid export membrane protein